MLFAVAQRVFFLKKDRAPLFLYPKSGGAFIADSTAPEKRGKKTAQSKPPTEPVTEERIVSLPPAKLHSFPNHTFKVILGYFIRT